VGRLLRAGGGSDARSRAFGRVVRAWRAREGSRLLQPRRSRRGACALERGALGMGRRPFRSPRGRDERSRDCRVQRGLLPRQRARGAPPAARSGVAVHASARRLQAREPDLRAARLPPIPLRRAARRGPDGSAGDPRRDRRPGNARVPAGS
jgi:hypothetical protein